MSLLTVVKDVCAVVGVTLPTSVFSGLSANRTMQEMLTLANEMAQRIAYDTRDWTILRAQAIIVGDGVNTGHNLPADYKRMLLTANVWRSTDPRKPLTFYPDTDEWMRRRAAGDVDPWGEWTIMGGQIHIFPILPFGGGATARFSYMVKNCITLNAGGVGDAFMADDDSFRLDERLLKLGMLWQWKAQKGSPYAEDMGTYSDALQVAMGHDSPAPIIADRLPISRAARVAYPWPVPT